MDAVWRSELPAGTEVDTCRIERVLSAGGFGISCLATHLRLKARE